MFRRALPVSAAVLTAFVCSSCLVGPSYYLRQLTLKGFLPSSRIRVVSEDDKPHIDASIRMDVNTTGDIHGLQFPYPERWISDSGQAPDPYRYADSNVAWMIPAANPGVSLDFYPLTWLSPFIDVQATIFDGEPLYTVAGGLGLLLRGDRLSGRVDGSLKITKVWYDGLLRDDYHEYPDMAVHGIEYARGFAVQTAYNTMFDFLFLRYYFGAGYELLAFDSEIQGELIQATFRMTYFAAGLYRSIGPVTAMAGARAVMEHISMLDVDPGAYPEFDFQIVGTIPLPRLRDR